MYAKVYLFFLMAKGSKVNGVWRKEEH